MSKLKGADRGGRRNNAGVAAALAGTMVPVILVMSCSSEFSDCSATRTCIPEGGTAGSSNAGAPDGMAGEGGTTSDGGTPSAGGTKNGAGTNAGGTDPGGSDT